MRTIRKGPEPKQLTQHRHANAEDYDGFPAKEELRRSLVRDQRGLCCYCLSRINADREDMRIEHWRSQHSHPSERLVYSNLLAACKGSENGIDSHCDVSKGSRPLSRNPANPSHAVDSLIRYENGLIVASDPELDRDVNETLNLNCKFLQQARKQTLTAFQVALRKRALHKKDLHKLLAIWNGDLDAEELKPYCMIVVYWLKKKLHRV